MVEITYHKEGDYFIPDLFLEKEEYAKDYNIGKYGHLRLEYLKNHKKAEYIIMFMNKTLRKHIVETDKHRELIRTIYGTNDIVNDVKQVYLDEFEQARIEYNTKQNRDDRKI